MNRFEQKSMSFGRKLVYLLPILAFLVLFVLFLQGIGSVSESTLTKQQESLETALGRSISQCYAVEGCYPPSLEYLEQHGFVDRIVDRSEMKKVLVDILKLHRDSLKKAAG